MKIAFCTLPLLDNNKIRGIGTYTRNLLDSLKQNSELSIQEFTDINEVIEADIVHYPFFDLFKRSLQVNKKFPTVVTIHDVIPLANPKHYPAGKKGLFNLFLQKRSLRNVSAVITDSHASKKDIIKYLKVPESKIFPISLAPAGYFHKIEDKKELEKVKDKFNLPKNFILFTGNVNWNKNLINLTDASLKADMDLVLVGKSFEERNNLDHPEMKSFKNFLKLYSNNPRIHILGFVEALDLVAITNLAKLVLFPSFAEGFGLPILEAQICGVPVVTSNVSSMPEVAGRGALMVDPNSVDDIAGAISRIIKNKDLREELINEGYKNVNRYSWKKVATDTIEVYAKILHS